MKRKLTKKAIAAVMFAAVILFTASCQLISTAPSGTEGNIIISKDPIYSGTETTAEATEATVATTEETSASTVPSETTHEIVQIGPLYENPLTKTDASLDPSGLRPMAVVVDNNANALAHQTGLTAADILCETLTAPGITRFLAVYSDYRAAPEICNVRAARVHDVDLAAIFDAFLVCHGGHADTTAEYDFSSAVKKAYGSVDAYIDTMAEPAWNARNGDALGTIRYYDSYRTDLRYDTVVTPAAIEFTATGEAGSAFSRSGASIYGAVKNPFTYSDARPSGSAASEVALTFTATGVSSNLTKNVTFKYSAEKNAYLRYEGARAHVDSQSGEQLAFTNLVVLLTDVKYIAGDSDADPLTTSVTVYGSGTGYVFSGGRCTEVIWVNTAESGLMLYTTSGALSLLGGNTYIGYLNKAYDGGVKVTG